MTRRSAAVNRTLAMPNANADAAKNAAFAKPMTSIVSSNLVIQADPARRFTARRKRWKGSVSHQRKVALLAISCC